MKKEIGNKPHWCRFYRCSVLIPLYLPGLVSSDKESAYHVLQRPEGGNLLAIIVGGSQEALDARPGSCTLLLKNRKGFVRVAIEQG